MDVYAVYFTGLDLKYPYVISSWTRVFRKLQIPGKKMGSKNVLIGR